MFSRTVAHSLAETASVSSGAATASSSASSSITVQEGISSSAASFVSSFSSSAATASSFQAQLMYSFCVTMYAGFVRLWRLEPVAILLLQSDELPDGQCRTGLKGWLAGGAGSYSMVAGSLDRASSNRGSSSSSSCGSPSLPSDVLSTNGTCTSSDCACCSESCDPSCESSCWEAGELVSIFTSTAPSSIITIGVSSYPITLPGSSLAYYGDDDSASFCSTMSSGSSSLTGETVLLTSGLRMGKQPGSPYSATPSATLDDTNGGDEEDDEEDFSTTGRIRPFSSWLRIVNGETYLIALLLDEIEMQQQNGSQLLHLLHRLQCRGHTVELTVPIVRIVATLLIIRQDATVRRVVALVVVIATVLVSLLIVFLIVAVFHLARIDGITLRHPILVHIVHAQFRLCFALRGRVLLHLFRLVHFTLVRCFRLRTVIIHHERMEPARTEPVNPVRTITVSVTMVAAKRMVAVMMDEVMRATASTGKGTKTTTAGSARDRTVRTLLLSPPPSSSPSW
uniref:Uncharacterized protein n=1 Tax=Anopheles farauti TaxID=69004 RepID=A0A182QT07_9DIPT